MEEALARLYAKMTGLPERPDALSDSGAENRMFAHRLAALQSAANAYFVRIPSQFWEGVTRLLADTKELSIKRHRIAHGKITQWGEFKIPDDAKGAFQVESLFLFRWGAPWYSMITLGTGPVGTDAAAINTACEVRDFS
jgi:hypothetical protein